MAGFRAEIELVPLRDVSSSEDSSDEDSGPDSGIVAGLSPDQEPISLNQNPRNPTATFLHFRVRRCCLDLFGPKLFEMIDSHLRAIEAYRWEYLFEDGQPLDRPRLPNSNPMRGGRGPLIQDFHNCPILFIDVSRFADRFIVTMADALTQKMWVYDTFITHQRAGFPGLNQRAAFLNEVGDLPAILCNSDVKIFTTKHREYLNFLTWLGLAQVPAAKETLDPTVLLYGMDPVFLDRYESELTEHEGAHPFMLSFAYFGNYLGPKMGRFQRESCALAPAGWGPLGLELLGTHDQSALYNLGIVQTMAMQMVFFEFLLNHMPPHDLFHPYNPLVRSHVMQKVKFRYFTASSVAPQDTPEWLRQRTRRLRGFADQM